ncbi:hypothetical protein LP419_20275 [Massilia sp. H-1]|nr:hypothetical protein LP419_20275 [Massilia sp. H-1]
MPDHDLGFRQNLSKIGYPGIGYSIGAVQKYAHVVSTISMAWKRRRRAGPVACDRTCATAMWW